MAQSIAKPGGSGDASDVALVVAELEKWPDGTIEALKMQGTTVIVCRGSITDYRTDLKGVKPRGWPPGSTWDKVPGANGSDRNEVVIAVIGHAQNDPHVPRTGEGHGSVNLVVHESGHAVDLNQGGANTTIPSRSTHSRFQAARNKDLNTLDAYESQPDPAGSQETWAESAARFYHPDATDLSAHPNLHAFWAGRAIGPKCYVD